MANRIHKLFSEKKKDILSVFFTAGYPHLNDTVSIIEGLEKEGVDLIEIGFPFSDPLADGPVIQQSSKVALENGMTLNLLFEQLKDIRSKVKIPLLLMGYLNPVMQFGVENFCKKASEIGIDGIILPDLPLQEYLDHYQRLFERYNLSNIFLVTPQTVEQRIRMIDKNSNGFIYLVSSASTTGTQNGVSAEKEKFFQRINKLKLRNPVVTGFGISDRASFASASKYCNGAIIGSAFIKALEQGNDIQKNIHQFISNVR
jgi:tryptophan synthase alpha chain